MIQLNKNYFYLIICLCFAGAGLSAQDISPEIIRLKAAYSEKAAVYLLKGDSLSDFFEIADEGIRMYKTPEERKLQKPELVLYWNEIDVYKSLVQSLPVDSIIKMYENKGVSRWEDSFLNAVPPARPPYLPAGSRNKPLLGMKIALDPGHMGGTAEMAFIEKKMVKIHKEELNGFPADILFNEGNLTLGTGLALKQKLEDAGANVMMTRSRAGETAFGITFDEWLKSKYPDYLIKNAERKKIPAKDVEFWLTKASPEQIFHKVFKHADLEERARIINEYRPDFTVFIHYNVKESNEMDPQGYIHAVKDNFNMAFIPGAYLNHELDSLENRMNFLRHLVTSDIERSLQLSSSVLREFGRLTEVPAVPRMMEDSLKYLGKNSMRTSKTGVYARNLALNERVIGPVVFGESLNQDNEKECIRLFSIDANVNGFRVSPRVKEIAEAYFLGIITYVTGKTE